MNTDSHIPSSAFPSHIGVDQIDHDPMLVDNAPDSTNRVPPPAPTNTTQQSTASSSIPDHNTGADHPVAGDKLTATAKAESTAKYDSDNKNDSADRNLPTPPTEPPDLSTTIPGMYRILDLISEQGSGGLVDKIIISQDSLRDFVNTLSPGAYSSMTKVNFHALDKLGVKPMGIYGSKTEIVRFLLTANIINKPTSEKMLAPQAPVSGTSEPGLRSGLYVVRPPSATKPEEQLYIVYWPQDTTWNDNAPSADRRNRVTFMRYLTKICDQIVALVSHGDAESIVWHDDKEDDAMDDEEDESDRLFTFEVEKTKEQEENVTTRPGFQVNLTHFINPLASSNGSDGNKLLFGETSQGFFVTKSIPSTEQTRNLNDTLTPLALQNLIGSGALRFGPDIDDTALTVLLGNGLCNRFPNECDDWKKRREAARKASEDNKKSEESQVMARLNDELPQTERILTQAMRRKISDIFPTLNCDIFGAPDASSEEPESPITSTDLMTNLTGLYPGIGELFDRTLKNAKIEVIKPQEFKHIKEKLIVLQYVLEKCDPLQYSHSQREKVISLIISIRSDGREKFSKVCEFLDSTIIDDSRAHPESSKPWWDWSILKTTDKTQTPSHRMVQRALEVAKKTSDVEFLSRGEQLKQLGDSVQAIFSVAVELAQSHLNDIATRTLKKILNDARRIQKDECMRRIGWEASNQEQKDSANNRTNLLCAIEQQSLSAPQQHTHVIQSIEEKRSYAYTQASYHVVGHRKYFEDPANEYTIHVLNSTADDKHNMQLDPTFIPSPSVSQRLSHSFRLTQGKQIVHAQLLENDRFLLIIQDNQGRLLVFLETLAKIGDSIVRDKFKKQLHQEKIGNDFVLSFDESKRMLAICASSKLELHVFVFDETYGSLQALGSLVRLSTWYPQALKLLRICFVAGSEEILLVDSDAQARIFSLVTLQFRPASVDLRQIPHSVNSTPDGSCLLVSYTANSATTFVAYHWSTFGSTDGVSLGSLDVPSPTTSILTSFNRRSIHLVGLDLGSGLCMSVTLDITRKITEFMFKEKGVRHDSRSKSGDTMHNCLIDCHADVWRRFPVVPAVRRQTISSSSQRETKALLFVTHLDHERFKPYFRDMIEVFERTTRKPTGDELGSMLISAVTFDEFVTLVASCADQGMSRFRAGEWLVEFLCLIPIHIAITKENRFIPLKDGVSSAELERSLLGAEVGRIVDSLSFGWYESIFQSYMASKPVKVVSSMGEQSVGKSFALNHLVDTSFAGSAMRTTEGVWMSVTPTDDALIVALDFEGVHSIERSAQEDTLLVLFNTAISNLVLFRNNFALSRDITGLFSSFQSSSTVLDPSANPSLFQSTLVIIIKDVVDQDKTEITREFSLKFQQIVEKEQDANFISRLHSGRLNIIPWPVIESKEFYKLFPTLKRRLDRQSITHHSAGEFLDILKTLMAKLKANDWGALSQTMAAHRAQLLLAILPNALSTGFAESDPDLEPLKNFDTDTVVDKDDTPARFYLAPAGSYDAARETALSSLRNDWASTHPRQHIPDTEWVSELSSHLDSLVDVRVEHVHEWIVLNLSRFQSGHANIDTLRRTFETAKVDLKAGVQLCKTQCSECQLLCTKNRSHEGLHDCQTSHKCIHNCDFCREKNEENLKGCTMSAGHPGKHICIVTDHLCGEQCKHVGKQGCLEECIKIAGHNEGDHLCAANVHKCGQPCALQGMTLANNNVFSCSDLCSISCEDEHDEHMCDARLCPVPCQLCRRLCANQDHLHGLETDSIHLCGQEHPCPALCAAPGVCEIDTTPQSIEATFTGRHETFQYTKYSQVAKRLQCVQSIPPGETRHPGSHIHSSDEKVFHFCTTRCENCGYYCTLPLGHSQQEHETSHGSMSHTRWAVDGADGTSLELRGRKYSSNDDGAPMMCNLVCLAMGRHVHVDYCRAEEGTPCDGADVQHIPTRMVPDPDRLKDFVTHSLYWRRTGFKDPYPRDDQETFAKCDAMCGGPEHTATGGGSGQPSYCTLPMFHPPSDPNAASVGLGYVSNDGHLFSCRNPVVMQQAFHVIFVIDRSGSMSSSDRRPLANTPVSARISQSCNNRLGAVYSALYSFWSARNAATTTAGQQAVPARRDAYSLILFDHTMSTCLSNDFTSSPDQLLEAVLAYRAGGGTNFTQALRTAETVMERNFSTERSPIIIFLSDGECDVSDQTVQDLCRSAVRLGKPLSLHAVSFGPDSSSSYLRRMAQIAKEAQDTAPPDPLAPATAKVISSYSQALDTVRLAETFLGIADSLRKPRGSLLR